MNVELIIISDPCNPVNPCQNGGVCKLANNAVGFECSCPNGYSGADCGTGNVCIGRTGVKL